MEKRLIIGNWKQNKTLREAKDWLAQVKIDAGEKEIVLCPPYTLLYPLKQEIESLGMPLQLGAQDFPASRAGKHTGEEPGDLLADVVDFAIIGHSERRQDFSETDELLSKKVKLAKELGMEVIFCIQDKNTFIPSEVNVVAYEPVSAIGTGNPDDPAEVAAVVEAILSQRKDLKIIYGGSVTSENVSLYTSLPGINGVLVGTASLDPAEFTLLVKNA